MKTLTLTQPWATLVAIGAKKFETRSWKTFYRGPLAIHAAKGFPKWAQELCFQEPFQPALGDHIKGLTSNTLILPKLLPTGCIVATCELTAIYPTLTEKGTSEGVRRIDPNGFIMPPDEPELSFGDYSPDRFAWVLENIQPLAEPIPAKGSLSLWEWEQSHD